MFFHAVVCLYWSSCLWLVERWFSDHSNVIISLCTVYCIGQLLFFQLQNWIVDWTVIHWKSLPWRSFRTFTAVSRKRAFCCLRWWHGSEHSDRSQNSERPAAKPIWWRSSPGIRQVSFCGTFEGVLIYKNKGNVWLCNAFARVAFKRNKWR